MIISIMEIMVLMIMTMLAMKQQSMNTIIKELTLWWQRVLTKKEAI